jgi:transcriptional regulator with XRE-family HTH domain
MSQTAQLTGITQGYISQIENGIYSPSAKTLAKLARVYKVPEIHLLRKAGIVQPSMQVDTPATNSEDFSEADALNPLGDIAQGSDLVDQLRRTLAGLEYLSGQFRQRGVADTLPAYEERVFSPHDGMPPTLDLPVYDDRWQPVANAEGEPSALQLPSRLCAYDSEAFIVTAGDDSMSPLIRQGDWVVISPSSGTRSGDTVAINDRNRILLRRFSEAEGIQAYTPINVPPTGPGAFLLRPGEKVEVLGRVVRLINREL